MAASSHFHRGAVATTNAHYRPLPADHESMYTGLATSWNNSHGVPRVPLQRSFAAHYLDYAGPSDYVNHSPTSQSTWSANYVRPVPHEWANSFNSLNDGSHTVRLLPYAAEEARATAVPHTIPPPRQDHDATDAAHLIPFNAPGTVYQSAAHQLPPEPLGAPTVPSFIPHAPNLTSVARLPNPVMHNNDPHEPSHALGGWPTGSSAEPLPLPYPAQNAGDTDTTVSSDGMLVGQGHMSTSSWRMLNIEASNIAPVVYEQVPHADSEWHSVGTQQQSSSAVQTSNAVTPSRRARRSAPKKSLARVSAAYLQRQPKVKISRRKGPLSEAKRQKTHNMRKNKSTCMRCRFYKTGCSGGDICDTCDHMLNTARCWKGIPCIRDRLEDMNVVRRCHARSNQEEAEFCMYEWEPETQVYMMDIIWNLPGYGPISREAPAMHIGFRQYRPNRLLLDDTVSVWKNNEGNIQTVEQPPYAIFDTAAVKSTVERYFTGMLPNIEAWIFNRVRPDPIASLTYQEAARIRAMKPRGNKNLIDLAMRMQCLSVVSQGYGTILNEDIPGIREYDYKIMGRSTYEAYDRTSLDRPLTHAMNHQMDVAALKYLNKLEKLFMKELWTHISKSKIKPWYEIYLALYVLLWNMEYIHRSAREYLEAKSGTRDHMQVSSVVSNQLKKWDFAFKIITYHWMAVLRDFWPLKLARENPEELRVNGHVDAEGFAYLMKITRIFDQIGFGRSITPYVGQPSTHDSMSSEWIRTLFQKAFGL